MMCRIVPGLHRSQSPGAINVRCVNRVAPEPVPFQKVTVTFFVTFILAVFLRKKSPKSQMLRCYLFWKGCPSYSCSQYVRSVLLLRALRPSARPNAATCTRLHQLAPDTISKVIHPAGRKP